jgi:hypothetical protein
MVLNDIFWLNRILAPNIDIIIMYTTDKLVLYQRYSVPTVKLELTLRNG